ncbi:HNH endonuclease [Phycicoccus sp. CSK15P-2]|uniref:HNH endonuclease n=1 Tax=Phycicoccus sp. CSK15P-2 TaxID=2807627 RepID=UPI001EF23E43|nr:HNH endonuclease [Phycicoccus sp. CSK15P-2]
MTRAWGPDDDAELRTAAMEWLARRTNDGADPLTTEEIKEFRFHGEPMPLMDMQRGIRKPAVLDAALSFRTVYRAEGAERPYEDAVGPDGLIRYKYRGTDPTHPENRALRSAMQRKLPLIWFFGVGPAIWLPTYPVYIVGEEPGQHQFVVDAVTNGAVTPQGALEETLKRYITVETRRRLHQPIFRATVMRAYETRCAVCALGHSQLLDAAHIVPDRDEAGVAAIRNGLALCKIHHAAFDTHILGVRPDLVVEIRADLLEEVDGPMLRHGLQGRHGQRLMVVPSARKERPDRHLLEISYETFRTASWPR